MSTAEKISARYGNDGQRFSANGVWISCACEDESPRRISGFDGDCRYIFADGSVITIAGGGWDLGYPDCMCWLGVGHRESCEVRS